MHITIKLANGQTIEGHTPSDEISNLGLQFLMQSFVPSVRRLRAAGVIGQNTSIEMPTHLPTPENDCEPWPWGRRTINS